MNSNLLILGCLLVLSLNSQAQSKRLLWMAHQPAHFVQEEQSSEVTYTLVQEFDGTVLSTRALGNFSSSKWISEVFTASETFTLTKIGLVLNKDGSPTQSIHVYIYSDNSGVPGSLLGSATDIPHGDVPGTADWVYTTGISLNLTASTVYWLVIAVDSSDSSNFYRWTRQNTGATSCSFTSSDGITWASGNNYYQKLRLYK